MRERNSFPLHYIVFKQTASRLAPSAREGNSEQLFSRAGDLSDDNGKMDPAQLSVWTSIGVNYSTYRPPTKKILERYLLKFSKGGKGTPHEDDVGLLDQDSTSMEGGGYYVTTFRCRMAVTREQRARETRALARGGGLKRRNRGG